MTATETDTEAAFWAAVGANPGDRLPRLVFADWLEENAGEVGCSCHGGVVYAHSPYREGQVPAGWDADGMMLYGCRHHACRGTGRVSDGRADLAAALRATADRVPYRFNDPRAWGWWCPDTASSGQIPSQVAEPVGRLLTAWSGNSDHPEWADYPTAEAAVRDLCRAWVEVHRRAA